MLYFFLSFQAIGQNFSEKGIDNVSSDPAESHHTGSRLIFELNVANDMTYFTDHYFSSGIGLHVYIPFMTGSPFNKLLLPDQKKSLNYYSLTLVHHMYTPVYIDTLSNRTIDHPFAAYFLLGNRKESFNNSKRNKPFSLAYDVRGCTGL
ncbi:MAG: lipid A deacylase LpxR family protein [Bacteroidales bacterium]|nr:lipid A deacylase LpxR family protein [Bacteroidales bacterium]